MEILLKEKIHQLIDSCENDSILEEIKEILENNDEDDWWNTDLTKEEQDEILEDAKQVDAGNFITNEEVMRKFEEWKRR